jgi:ADP-ribosylglycohydrolase
MPDTTIRDRAEGALMGAFIGDALGLGPHWYYDLDELRRDHRRQALSSSCCSAPSSPKDDMMKPTSAAGWMKSCCLCSTALR